MTCPVDIITVDNPGITWEAPTDLAWVFLKGGNIRNGGFEHYQENVSAGTVFGPFIRESNNQPIDISHVDYCPLETTETTVPEQTTVPEETTTTVPENEVTTTSVFAGVTTTGVVPNGSSKVLAATTVPKNTELPSTGAETGVILAFAGILGVLGMTVKKLSKIGR